MKFLKLNLPDGTEFKVDVEDIPKIFNQSWHIFKTKGKLYIRGWDKTIKKKIFLHRVLLNVTNPKIQIDHINGDTLDNRKKNLRICNNAQNMRNKGLTKANTSGIKGVSWCKASKKWRAKITVDGKQIHLGVFTNKYMAKHFYQKASKKYHKEFGRNE